MNFASLSVNKFFILTTLYIYYNFLFRRLIQWLTVLFRVLTGPHWRTNFVFRSTSHPFFSLWRSAVITYDLLYSALIIWMKFIIKSVSSIVDSFWIEFGTLKVQINEFVKSLFFSFRYFEWRKHEKLFSFIRQPTYFRPQKL